MNTGPSDPPPANEGTSEMNKSRNGIFRVLYIEDTVVNVRLMERILARRENFEMISAADGESGLKAVQQQKPNLVLLDLNLPDINGDEVLERIKSDPQSAGTTVLVISGDATARHKPALLKAGAAAYLTKPLDIPALLTMLDGYAKASSAPPAD